MAYRVFLSYSLDPHEQALAWRLQSLAAAHGIEMYVPQYSNGTSRLPGTTTVEAAIKKSDCVLAIIATPAGAGIRRELQIAARLKKPVIPILLRDVTAPAQVVPRAFQLRPYDDPGKLESKVVAYRRGLRLGKEKQQAIGALVVVGIGLLLLSSLET